MWHPWFFPCSKRNRRPEKAQGDYSANKRSRRRYCGQRRAEKQETSRITLARSSLRSSGRTSTIIMSTISLSCTPISFIEESRSLVQPFIFVACFSIDNDRFSVIAEMHNRILFALTSHSVVHETGPDVEGTTCLVLLTVSRVLFLSSPFRPKFYFCDL